VLLLLLEKLQFNPADRGLSGLRSPQTSNLTLFLTPGGY